MESAEDGSSQERPLKDGERMLAPTRRPDGTMRKPIRIRAGYTPQDEVAIYQSKGALFRRGTPQVPPGYDPAEDSPQKAKTKSAKKNVKRKEKKQQAAAPMPKPVDGEATHSGRSNSTSNSTKETASGGRDDAETVALQMSTLTISLPTSYESSQKEANLEKVDLEKRIRALRKKIRLTESLQMSLASKGTLNPEQSQKLASLEQWRIELKKLEAGEAST